MIIVRLMGGLGNQMFQYAAGKALSLRHNTELRLDTRFLNECADSKDTRRELELGVFVENLQLVSDRESEAFLSVTQSRISRVFQRFVPFILRRRYFAEMEKRFSSDFWKLPKDVYLDGYWQSEQYFIAYAEEIRNIFLRYDLLDKESQDTLAEIKASESVSLHVRRGDYVSNRLTNLFHGVCSTEYYNTAVNLINDKRGFLPTLFVFSDDIDWCKQNLHFRTEVHFIEHNSGRNSFQDMLLMSSCSHHIIANSSFSWWGAWLNHSAEKTVVAPRKWFADPSIETADMVPPLWSRI